MVLLVNSLISLFLVQICLAFPAYLLNGVLSDDSADMAKGKRMLMKRQDNVALDANGTAAGNVTGIALQGNCTVAAVTVTVTDTVTDTVTVDNAGATLVAGNGTDTATKAHGKKGKGGKGIGGKKKGEGKKGGGAGKGQGQATEAATAAVALV